MKVLVVGGTGMIGAHAALYLQGKGHQVTLMARSKPTTPALASLAFIQGNYVEDDCSDGRLEGFDWLVFAAGADLRQIPRDGSVTEEDFYERVNVQGIPRFFEAARDAGIKRACYIGTFYPRVVPEKAKTSAYVRSRKLADEAVRALSTDGFAVVCLDAPFVMGHVPGMTIDYLQGMVAYAKGQLGLPIFAPEGGTNHITCTGLSEAVLGALEKGEPGRGYLVGDQNLTWKTYLEKWFTAVGNPTDLEVRPDEHPLFPDIIMFAGRNATVSYEPEGVKELGYRRGLVDATIAEIVKASGG